MPLLDRNRLDFHALATFRFELRRFLNFSEQAARAAGLEPQQHQALLAVKGLPAGRKATIGYLAERLQIHHNSAVELSNRLEARHLFKRVHGNEDHREVLLHLTPRGDALLRKLSVAHRDELRAAGPNLLRALAAAVSARAGTRTGAPRKSAGKKPRQRYKRHRTTRGRRRH